MNKARVDGRTASQLRPVALKRGTMKFADASCLIEWGDTKVLCSATVEENVPPFLRGKGRGWVTAEYGMLPRSSQQRIVRESAKGKLSGRTQEIQRLIGRSLRSVMRLDLLGERQIVIDCDVIQADGGTRCAAITGGFVALADCLRALKRQGILAQVPLTDSVAAVSMGVCEGQPLLDLNYPEDSTADVDMNLVMTGSGKFVEIQGTAERTPFGSKDLASLVRLGEEGLAKLRLLQYKALGVPSFKRLVSA